VGWYSRYDWRPHVSVAQRRRNAAKRIASMKKSGHKVAPVVIEGRKIAQTFWGDAWCRNLEAYSDYSNRLPRGRTYVRNGSVIDLQIEAGRVRALVSGTDIYEVDIRIEPLPSARWSEIKTRCAGQIGSLVELLRGAISRGVMAIVTRKGDGLFPSPGEIKLGCSCPDWATMCKHVAATLYGVGARLDHEADLLFTLRGVDPTEMVEAAVERTVSGEGPRRGQALASNDLSSLFGVDIDVDPEADEPRAAARSAPAPRNAAPRNAAPRNAAPRNAAPRNAAPRNTRQNEASRNRASKSKASKNHRSNVNADDLLDLVRARLGRAPRGLRKQLEILTPRAVEKLFYELVRLEDREVIRARLRRSREANHPR